MNQPVISIEGISKRYRLGVIGGATFREEVSRWWARQRGREDPWAKIGQADHGNRDKGHVWALRDVSFEVQEGEILGIIGGNGAGKSTLLKILSRIVSPTEGRIRIRGRVASLLEVGTGFHQELTGRENIYLNGAILGMSRQEITLKLDQIIEFSDIEQYIDTPVKRYSSGMRVRLAFAVAAHLDPEILVIDEVLAVGDMAFQRKCIGKMGEVAQSGKTVLFVSHQMGTVSRLCSRGLILSKGQVVASGDTDAMVSRYLSERSEAGGEYSCEEGFSNPGVTEIALLGVRILSESGEVSDQVKSTGDCVVEVDYRVAEPLSGVRLGVVVSLPDGTILFESYDTDHDPMRERRVVGDFQASCRIPGSLLVEGSYFISINAGIPNIKNMIFAENVLRVEVVNTGGPGSGMLVRRRGLIRPDIPWTHTSS